MDFPTINYHRGYSDSVGTGASSPTLREIYLEQGICGLWDRAGMAGNKLAFRIPSQISSSGTLILTAVLSLRVGSKKNAGSLVAAVLAGAVHTEVSKLEMTEVSISGKKGALRSPASSTDWIVAAGALGVIGIITDDLPTRAVCLVGAGVATTLAAATTAVEVAKEVNNLMAIDH